MLQFITSEILQKIIPTLSVSRATQVCHALNLVCPIYGLDKPDLFHEFIANAAHESGGFTRYQENMNYSAERLLVVFPKYFNATTAKQYAHQKEKIANRVYANRMGNGPESSGDGYKHRGGGAIQLTGADMYKKYFASKGKTSSEQLTLDKLIELTRTDEIYAIDSACWLFAVEKKLIPAAAADDLLFTVKRINGGTIGLRERQDYYERAKKFLPG
jgi:putative chitinase